MVTPYGPIIVLGTALVLTGCSSGSAGAVEQAVERFGSAWESADGAAVCDLLAPATRDEVESATGKACPSGVLEEDLGTPGTVESTQVWGDSAQVRAAGDTLFLARFPTGWKVMAAGCRPLPDRPYDCTVTGG